MPAATARAAEEHPEPTAPGWPAIGLRVSGAGLLIATAAIHLDLYVTGYRTIPTIGWLFLLQVITAFGLGLAVFAIGGRLVQGGRLAAAAGAGFALATLGGYLLTVWIGLFGFKEVRTTAGVVAGLIEVAAFAVLAALTLTLTLTPTLAATPAAAAVTDAAAASVNGAAPADGAAAGQARFPARIPASVATAAAMITAALTIAALVLLGVAVTGASSRAPAAAGIGAGLKTTTIGGATVLTNAKGFTVYWFGPDTPTTSKCYGSCAAYWPPVTGTAAASPGVPGRIGTIIRTGGSRQLTYNGHPLYTYIADTVPGLARGNNINLNGGLWHEVLASQ
jgi:predicted lipoprotein with Yx(FWY)xxD motif